MPEEELPKKPIEPQIEQRPDNNQQDEKPETDDTSYQTKDVKPNTIIKR